MSSPIHRFEATEFWIRERCYVKEMINTADISDFSMAEVRVEKGVWTELHQLSVNEWYFIIEGQGRMEVRGQPTRDVKPGDVVSIPAHTPQRILNTGEQDLIFQCICIPRFTPDSYKSLEDELETVGN